MAIPAEQVMKMTLAEVEKAEAQFWNLPKVENGAAQVPYLHSAADISFLNACMKRRAELDSAGVQ